MTDTPKDILASIPSDIQKTARAVLADIDADFGESPNRAFREGADAIAKAILAERERSQWQPIETIPEELRSQPDRTKNWPQVLVYGHLGFFSVAHVRQQEDGTMGATAFTDGLPPYHKEHYGPIEVFRPTHWMPLPAAPKGEA